MFTRNGNSKHCFLVPYLKVCNISTLKNMLSIICNFFADEGIFSISNLRFLKNISKSYFLNLLLFIGN